MKVAKFVRESTTQSEESKAKKLKKTEEFSSQESDGDEDNDDEPIGEIDFNMPKPGPHAKAGEWRKWKMMKRAIRQKREEKRIIKQKQKEIEAEESKKAKAEKEASEEDEINGSKPAKRDYSLSIAISGSVMSKIKSKELRTCLTGQIARVAVLYSVDEIIVYNELPTENKFSKENDEQFIKILEYLECPQYLRKALFPPNKHLEHVGLLVPLEAPHHFRINDEWNYREGVTTDIPSKDGKGSWVDIGLMNKIQIDKKLEPGIRVTVKKSDDSSPKKLKGEVVSPETPRSESGIYWGYQVRYAESFRKILTQSSFKAHYDLKIGVNLTNKLSFDKLDDIVSSKRPKRVLIVYGGVDGGIETAIEADENFKSNKIDEVFDLVCQGENPQFTSRSMRLEEALLISLSTIVPTFNRVWLHS